MNPSEHVKAKREKRAAARKAGMCGQCCIRRPADGMKTCDVCLANQKKLDQKPIGLCVDCQSHGRHRDGCPSIGVRDARKKRPHETATAHEPVDT